MSTTLELDQEGKLFSKIDKVYKKFLKENNLANIEEKKSKWIFKFSNEPKIANLNFDESFRSLVQPLSKLQKFSKK